MIMGSIFRHLPPVWYHQFTEIKSVLFFQVEVANLLLHSHTFTFTGEVYCVELRSVAAFNYVFFCLGCLTYVSADLYFTTDSSFFLPSNLTLVRSLDNLDT